MNIGIISENYPESDVLYNSSFVHIRVKEYIKRGYKTVVFRINFHANAEDKQYVFDKVKVYQGTPEYITEKIKKECITHLSIHMPNFRELNYVKKQHAEKNITLTFHGTESVWSSIIYPYDGNFLERITKFLYRITIDLHKRRVLKDFILTYRPKLIFVSKSWRKYTLDIINIKKVPYKIIYNPIDKELFRFRQRNGSLKRIICMRSHDTRKYALDIIIKMFRNSKYRIDIYGCGRLLPYHKRLAKRYNSNVKFIEKFYMHKQLGELYREYDLGVMLTRLDAQGVSACEMMQTGLPIITSDIFGNKEFTEKGCIRIPNDTKIRIDDVLERLNKRSVMMKLSREAHEYMDNKLDTKKIIEAELECLKK